jgi:hypothetical protein
MTLAEGLLTRSSLAANFMQGFTCKKKGLLHHANPVLAA